MISTKLDSESRYKKQSNSQSSRSGASSSPLAEADKHQPTNSDLTMQNPYNKVALGPGDTATRSPIAVFSRLMNLLIKILAKLGLLRKDLDYHLVRASMVIIYFFFGYQKWFPYEAHTLIPFIGNSPLISWMYPVFGLQGASWSRDIRTRSGNAVAVGPVLPSSPRQSPNPLFHEYFCTRF